MKKNVCLLLAVLFLACLCMTAAAEDITVEVPVVMGTGTGLSANPAPTRSNSVVPFAVVSWGDSAETVAQAASGEITDRDGTTVVKSSAQVEGLADEIPVLYYIGENGLYQVEAVASSNLAAKIEDLSASAAGQAIIAQTDAFFQGDDRYVWTGNHVKLFMSSNTTAALRCRDENNIYRLSVIYYPPEPFDTALVESAEGIIKLESGSDVQYYLNSPSTIVHPLTVTTPTALMYNIRVREYQVRERRIPHFSLTLRYAGSIDPGEAISLNFVIDGKQYSFTNISVSLPDQADAENLRAFNVTMDENCAPFWEALENASSPVKMTFRFNPPSAGVSTIDIELSDKLRNELVSGYQLYAAANGLSPLALDYASDAGTVLTVTDWEQVAGAVPEYTLDTSALPFAELKWDVKMNNLSKALGVKAEKEGDLSVIRTEVSIANIGDSLPVTWSFRNNKLASVRIIIESGVRNDPAFLETAKGQVLANYIGSFIAGHAEKSYSSQQYGMKYIVTDVSEIAYGVMKNGDSCDLSLEFYPAQAYDAAVLKKNKKIFSSPATNNDIMYYDSDPFYFDHAYTYNGRRYTYSCFNWVIQLREYTNAVGRIPCMYYYFEYAGVKDPSSTKWIAFTIDNTVYRFDVIVADKLSKTQYGELTEAFGFFIDCNNYVFLERLAKAKKVEVTVQGDNFMLNFDLPAKAKNKMIEGKKNFENLCGLIDGPLAFNRFNGSPVTIY